MKFLSYLWRRYCIEIKAVVSHNGLVMVFFSDGTVISNNDVAGLIKEITIYYTDGLESLK